MWWQGLVVGCCGQRLLDACPVASLKVASKSGGGLSSEQIILIAVLTLESSILADTVAARAADGLAPFLKVAADA